MGRLSGKVAIITGASKGLGEADARLFAKEGAQVILTDVDDDNGERVAREIGDAARFVKHDVRDEGQWDTLVNDVMKTEGALHILVNNAGVVEVGTIETQTLEEYKFIMDVSAQGTFLGCKYALAAMKDSCTPDNGGSLINMASIASKQGEHYVAAYCAAKGAVEALTRSVAVHCALGKLPVRANSIHPGGTDTPMVDSMPQKLLDSELITPQQLGGDESAGTPLADPIDVANIALFLASDESRFMNGTSILADKGMSVIAGVIPG